MNGQISVLLDTLLAGGVIQLLVGLALLRLALGLNDFVVGVAVIIAALAVALSGTSAELSSAVAPPSVSSQPSAEAVSLATRLRDRVDPVVAGSPLGAPTPSVTANPSELSELRAKVIVSDLKRALLWGVALLIPFLIIDLLLAHLFAMLEWQTLPVAAVSVPLKLLVFIGVGGWSSLVSWLTLATTGGVL